MKKCVLQYLKAEENQDNFELSDSSKQPEILKKLANMDPNENFNFSSNKVNFELADCNQDSIPNDAKDLKDEDDRAMTSDDLGDNQYPINKSDPDNEFMPNTNDINNMSGISGIKKQSKDSMCISDSEDSFNMSKNEIKLDKNVRVNFKKFAAMNFVIFIMYENQKVNKSPIAKHKHLIEVLISNDKFKH